MRTKSLLAIGTLLCLVLTLPLSLNGQDQSQTSAGANQNQQTSSDQPAEGVNRGNWNIQQSMELGYRWTGINGNERMYNSVANLHQGFRFLDQILSMRSLNHSGALFDNLYISSFGWNGDPNNGARWNISKNKAYTFTGNFRRDQNFFDYDLLANPLNPTSTTPAYPGASVELSPHSFELRRRMSDMSLVIAPQAAVSLRLGYMRNNMTGPSLSSFHEGTDVLLFQPWNTTLNGYRIGVDFKVLPKTIISFDENLQYFKNDIDWKLQPFASFTTTTGFPVEFGLPFNVPARQPCAAPFLGTTPNTANPACSGYESYVRNHRYRSRQPTEQLMLQSHAINKLDFVISGSYSAASMNDALDEHFLGVVVRPGVNERAFDLVGPNQGRRIAATVDAAGTYHFTDTWRANIDFHFNRFNIPGNWDSTETVFSPTTPAMIGGPLGTPVVTPELFEIFFGQNAKYLTGEIEHDFSRHFGARIGTRWTNRHISHRDFAEAEADTTDINEYTALVGVWLHELKGVRANADAEFSSADNFLTRISPRNQQRYRARLSYNPHPWAMVTGYLNFWEARNHDSAILYTGHNRNAGFDLNITPNDRFGIDIGYNFNGFLQNSNVCFAGSFSPPGTVTSTDPACVDAFAPTPALEVLGSFTNRVHYFSTSFYVRPVKRVTFNLGYSMDHSNGDVTRLNVLQPLGPLRMTYHQPLANLALEVYKNLTWNLGWNYWNYNDDNTAVSAGVLAPTLPRNFHSNVGTLSVRYAF